MANNLTFTISAVDKMTATINKINESSSKMTRPFENLSKSVKQMNIAANMNPLVRGMGAAANEAKGLASKVMGIGTPLAALTGAGVLVGLYDMVSGWAKWGQEIGNTSQALGISATNLNVMQNAAKLMGVSGDVMTQSFTKFQDVLQDAKWGRNQPAQAMLQRMGITLKKTKSGAVDAESAMADLADRIKKVHDSDPIAARRLAAEFGVENLLPALQKGGAAWRASQAEAKRLTPEKTPEMIKQADETAKNFEKLSIVTTELGHSMAAASINFAASFLDTSKQIDPITGMVNDVTWAAKGLYNYVTEKTPSKSNGTFNKNAASLGNLLARGESGSSGYNAVNLGKSGNYKHTEMNLSKMSLDQISNSQAKHELGAVGKYQMIGSTLTEATKKLGLSGKELFTPQLQEKLLDYEKFQKRPEIGNYITGKSDDIGSAALAASREWASVEKPGTGRSYYDKDGVNKASIASSEIMQSLVKERTEYAQQHATPQILVQNHVNIDRNGNVHTRTQTPSGVKIGHTAPTGLA